ncbi:MAG: hypothetical protein F6J93_40175 [Oscillatoria sp. SIO1A7]|nr:hypothetical protein [Oscillatoria sp. SIO1A7]
MTVYQSTTQGGQRVLEPRVSTNPQDAVTILDVNRVIRDAIASLDLTGADVQQTVDTAIANLNLTPEGIGAEPAGNVEAAIADLTVTDIKGAAAQIDIENLQREIASLIATATRTGAASFGHNWVDVVGINVNAGHRGRTAILLASTQFDRGNGTNSYIYKLRYGFDENAYEVTLTSSDVQIPYFGVAFQITGSGDLQVRCTGTNGLGRVAYFSNI